MTIADRTPVEFPFTEPPSLYHPAPELGELREECPVAPVVFPDGATAWLVTRHTDVRQVLTDPRFSRAHAVAGEVEMGLGRLASESILGLDPPEHTRLRRLVAGAFTARRVEQLRPRVTAIVDDLLLALRKQPQPADLVAGFSLALPVRVICDLLGVPESDQHRFHGWSDAAMGDRTRDPWIMMAAFASLQGYLTELIAEKRAHPADDLMTALIDARDNADRLSEAELVNLGVSLLIGGHETTANQIVMILLTLRAHPEQWAALRADPSRVPAAIEELMRFTQLGGGAGGIARVTTEPVELSGVTIPAGQAVLPALASANRDPRAFVDPDTLDLHRGDSHGHLGFGAGVHHCLGAQLARMELQEALAGILRTLPGFAIDLDDADIAFKPTMILRSVASLPVRWDES
ncbi:cytochrome P450 [Hamadaea flava]|uniref:Cytochrome P450 n=1 Tax=Hamadaea flava TaxID=1742688 RepID=A0ABV8LRT2_9ACTN|nr:cytochrome P450 [Hamadaea flava]MCP2321751.1 cytochrome P450 [Hamadaea flava]